MFPDDEDVEALREIARRGAPTLEELRAEFTRASERAEFIAAELPVINALMEREGLVAKSLYQDRPKRYEYRLSEKGEALLPVLQAMSRWANRFVPDSWTTQPEFLNRKTP